MGRCQGHLSQHLFPLAKLPPRVHQVLTNLQRSQIDCQQLVGGANRPVGTQHSGDLVFAHRLERQRSLSPLQLVRIAAPLPTHRPSCGKQQAHSIGQRGPVLGAVRPPQRGEHRLTHGFTPSRDPAHSRQPVARLQPTPLSRLHKRQVTREHHQRENVEPQGEHRHEVKEGANRNRHPLVPQPLRPPRVKHHEQEGHFPHDRDVPEHAQHQRMLRQPVSQGMDVVDIGHGPVHQLVAIEKRRGVHLGDGRPQVHHRHQQLNQPGRPDGSLRKIAVSPFRIQGPVPPLPPGVQRPQCSAVRQRQQQQQVRRDHGVLGQGAQGVQQPKPGVENCRQEQRNPGEPSQGRCDQGRDQNCVQRHGQGSLGNVDHSRPLEIHIERRRGAVGRVKLAGPGVPEAGVDQQHQRQHDPHQGHAVGRLFGKEPFRQPASVPTIGMGTRGGLGHGGGLLAGRGRTTAVRSQPAKTIGQPGFHARGGHPQLALGSSI